MTVHIDPSTLNAYLDGELDPQESAAVEQGLAADAGLRRELRALREVDGAVRGAFNHAVYAPLRPLDPPAPPATSPRYAGRWMPVALAAGLAGLIAGAAGVYLAPAGWPLPARAPVSASGGAGGELVRAAFSQALETRLSGDTLEWHDPHSADSGAVTPVRTWKTADGRYCREFVEERRTGRATERQGGIACRGAGGGWRTRVRYFPDA